MDHPADSDPSALALSTLAGIRGVPEEEWCHGPLFELAVRLARLSELHSLSGTLIDAISDTLIADMPTDTVNVPTVGRLSRDEVETSTWRDSSSSEQMREDLTQAIANSLAFNVRTGEIDEETRQVVRATMAAAYEAIPAFSS